MSRKSLLVASAFLATVFSCAASAGAPELLQPSAYFSYAFGGQPHSGSLKFGAQLDVSRTRLGPDRAAARYGAIQSDPSEPAYLKLDFAPGKTLTVQMLGAELAGYRFAQPDMHGALMQDGTSTENSGGWFSRNWWIVGLGAITAGVVAASSGGGSNDNGSGQPPGSDPSSPGGVGCTEDSCIIPCDSGPVITCNDGG